MCGCAVPVPSYALKRAGGPSPANRCPAFVSPAVVEMFQRNRDGWELIAQVLGTMGASLTASVVLAPIGAPLVAGSAALVALANGCDAAETMKANARLVARAAQTAAALSALGAGLLGSAGVVTALTGAGLVIGAGAVLSLGGLATALQTVAIVFDALGAGGTPSGTSSAAAAVAVGALLGVDLKPAMTALDGLARFSKEFQQDAKNPRLRVRVTDIGGAGMTITTSDDASLEAASRALLSAAARGVTAEQLNRFFGQEAQRSTSSATVRFILNRIWSAWTRAAKPTTTAALGSLLASEFSARRWWPGLARDFGVAGGSTIGTPSTGRIPLPDLGAGTRPIVGTRPLRPTLPTLPGTPAPPPPSSSGEGGGLAPLVIAGLALKFLL